MQRTFSSKTVERFFSRDGVKFTNKFESNKLELDGLKSVKSKCFPVGFIECHVVATLKHPL